MKHTYMAPKATTIKFFSEESLMVTQSSLGIGGQNGATVDTEGDVLSNKRQHPIWGEQHNGMWDNMSK